MKPLEQSVLDTIQQHSLITDDTTILVAVSGGPDSTALLSVLVHLFPESVKAAVYIDHKLRPLETGAELQHVKQLCNSFNIDFDSRSVDVQNVRMASGESPEACARRLRFEALDQLMDQHQADLVALGHTRDDQVEEVLIRLIRGSGMNGLSGMRVKNKHIIRPLLNSSKEEILDYLATADLPFCTDSSNVSRAYLRNKIRLELIPLLEQEFNPSIRQTVLNTAAILREEDSYLDELTESHYHRVVKDRAASLSSSYERSYRINVFMEFAAALRRRVLEKLFWQAGCPPTFQAIEEIIKLTEQGRTGTTIHFSGGLRIIRTADEIVFSSRLRDRNVRHRQADSFQEEVTIVGVGEYRVPLLGKTLFISPSDQYKTGETKTQYIDAHKAPFPLVLRAPAAGELFHPLGAPGKKKIARFFSDRKIPQHERYRYPVLVSQTGSVIAIPGMAISESVKISEKTSKILKIFWKQMS